MTSNLISTFRTTTRLFKQAQKIGDVLEYNKKHYLILGIEKFILYSNKIQIWYTCQDLSHTDYVNTKMDRFEPHMVEIYERFRHDDTERIKRMELGRTFSINGMTYKAMEYTEIKLIGTDIYISMAARPIFPIDRKEAKAVLFSERRKKINLELL